MSYKSNQFVSVLLSLRHRTLLDTYANIWLTNAEIDPEDGIPQYFPLIENVAGVGIAMDAFTPQFTSGSIRIVNSKDSLAFRKRLTDLSVDYVIQGAAAKVYVSLNPVKDNKFVDNKKLIYEGILESCSYFTIGDEQGQRVQLQVTKVQKEHQISQPINRNNSLQAPDNSIGKYLPLVIGEGVQVVPYSIAPPFQEGNIGFSFAYATCFRSFDGTGRKFINRGISKYLIADLDAQLGVTKKYREVKGAPVFSAPVYEQVGAVITGNNNKTNRQTCYPIPYNPGVTNPYLITTVLLVISSPGNPGTPSATGTISVKIHAELEGQRIPTAPREFLAEAVIDKSAYAAGYAAGTPILATAAFNRPVPICSLEKGYYLSVEMGNEEDVGSYTELGLASYSAGTPAWGKSWETSDDAGAANENTWRPATEGNLTAIFQLFGVEFIDEPEGNGIPSSRGLEVSGVSMKWQDYDGSRKIFAFDQLDMILEVDGIEDTDGAITGVPGTLINSPVDCADLLLHYYSEDRWQPGLFDRTKFADTHDVFNDTSNPLFRKVTGRTNGSATNIGLLSEIMRNTYSTLMYDGFGTAARYGVIGNGMRREITGSISDHDGQFQKYFFNSVDTVINTININYARRLDNVHFQTANDQEQFGEYSKTLSYDSNDDGVGESFSFYSYAHYGERTLSNENFDFIGDDQSAESVGQLYLMMHPHPFSYAQFEGVYARVEDFRLYDLIHCTSTELPNSGGTAARAYPNNDECAIIGDMVKAKVYVGEIVGIGFGLTPTELPTVVFLIRLIVNENDPNFRG